MAARAGLEVHAIDMPEGDLGYYAADEQRIYFNLICTPDERRAVIAHELGHHHYGHACGDHPPNERQADAYAATLLVAPDLYAELEQINSHAEWIAEEMGVTPEVILDYRTYCLQRLGRVTYTRARMGVGQWLHRGLLA
ncbi:MULTISPECIES: ImmA/IrrE family metallo-endopeptidase [unclassified Microbacterium]|uniref:ImmA/IrrE family metallo-endopeptidase n=1 Tax=unclassified Microbacterium TaxID=2609290 RepID=UPI000EAA329E|nr:MULTISPECIES: ImmA/IrrE family metallo-endopeptidase [unclassified Microbacterium]MBT2485773.1 ImmA/IrrE family metallo-endopeptidase [Microbacterium sp. ISL-108]RKN68536.1 ImmA/IrrE family metallo-endopeptidase [Microbacterium sp. CGR2]